MARMKKVIYLLLLIVCLFNVSTLKASPFARSLDESDTISVSLLTASPGKQIYEMFGHTGIRVHIPTKKFDFVYHYGLFSFEDPNFEYRFVKGETDYMIGVMHYHDFLTMYAIRGSGVRELPLKLTQKEARSLYNALNINMLPENQTYRYSFLFDNCATRPLEIIVRNLDGTFKFEPSTQHPTYRELIHECTKSDRWLTLGLDILLDSEVDSELLLPDEPFLPHITEQIFIDGKVENSGVVRDLTDTPYEVLKPMEMPPFKTIFDYITPVMFASMMLVIILLLSIYELFTLRHLRLLDTILFAVCGVLGVVIYFLLFFSEHPAVSANLNAMWLHPLWLLLIPFIWIRRGEKFLYCYHFINFAVLLLFFIAILFAQQVINSASILFVVILMLRSIVYLRVEYIKNRRKRGYRIR